MTPDELNSIEARHAATLGGLSSNPAPYIESAADVPTLVAEVRRLQAEGELLETRAQYAEDSGGEFFADAKTALARVRELEVALRRYGRHTANCLKGLGKGRCHPEHCGLDAALEGKR